MKQYGMFRAESGGIMLQHPDCPDALADGNCLAQALKMMTKVETAMGLDHLVDQFRFDALRELGEEG